MVKKFYVDKNYILGTLALKGETVTNFCKDLGCSRVYFYTAINRAYSKKGSSFIDKIIASLDLVKSLVWIVD